jgi:hypothetical protein
MPTGIFAFTAVTVAVVLPPASMTGQAQTAAGGTQAQSAARDEALERDRQVILAVADGLRATEAAGASVPGDWRPGRTPWGDPEIAGIYTNSDESGIPLEKPEAFAGRRQEDITPQELAELRVAQRERTIDLAARLSQDPNPPLFWWETLNAKNSRAWLIVDPPDGKVPPLTPDAERRQQARTEARRLSGRGPADSYIDRSLYDRCISRGLPGSMMPAIYGSAYQIHQAPGYVAIRYEMIHETRVIPLDGSPHVSASIRSYMGDARGRWEGNALVVETTNFMDVAGYRGANGSTLRMVERFTPVGPDAVEWTVTMDDSATWTRPWTFAMNLTKKDASQQPFEYACHEGNYGLRNILSGARADDAAAAPR